MTGKINQILIDNQTVQFNMSAWLGGYMNQDDNARISLTFLDHLDQQVGNNTTLGPVLSADRGDITKFLYRQTVGLVPAGARSFKVTLTVTRTSGVDNDGAADNIAINFYE